MRNYNYIQDASSANRRQIVGRIGEKLAEQVLAANGFTHIENLNRSQRNHKYADIYAEKDGERYVISVKARNKNETNSEKINGAYNLITSGDKNFAREAEIGRNATAAWLAISLEDTTFCAYFGLLSSLASIKRIPMRPKATVNYVCLAENEPHNENPLEFKNNDKKVSDVLMTPQPNLGVNMTETEIIQKLKKVSGVFETYQVIAAYEIIRNSQNGNIQKVRVEIFDAGEDGNPSMRYHCYATADDGTSATGNPDNSIKFALSNVHWEYLDYKPKK